MPGKVSTGVIALALLLGATILVSVRAASAANNSSRYGANYFPNVELTTQDGKTVHFYDDLLKGKIIVLDLIYTHCKDECPLETAKLAQVQRLLGDRVGKDIFFYSISIDPKADTPEVMKAYAEKFHAGPGWLFLTGKPADIDLISKKTGLYSPERGRDGHAPELLFGNEPTGQWTRTSALDNPRFLASMIRNFVGDWKTAKAEPANYLQAPAITITTGQYLFRTRCSACHTIGKGASVGPDLAGVTNVRDQAWLTRFIKTPDQVLAAQDPIATALFNQYKQVQMPNLRLGDEDVATLIDYLKTETAAPSGKAAAPSQSSVKTAAQAANEGMHK